MTEGCFISAAMRVNNRTKMLQLEEGTFDELPTHIHRALISLRTNRPSKMHILRALVYIVSLECGFHTIDNSEPFRNTSGCFNVNNVRKNIAFVSELSQDETVQIKLSLTESSTVGDFKLLTREIGDALCITFSYRRQPGRSIYVSSSRYVINSTLKEPPKCFIYLKELSMKLRNSLFTPVRNSYSESNNERFPSLNGLPSEVLWLILNEQSRNSLGNLSSTCVQMNSEIRNYRQSRAFF